ncbi:conditional loss-of-growth 1 [Anaeramoeba flamelloides]|uniref:Conditional loss-of-growth 1 n=1 Tax=Anaeramoeba flamelloides TaxID=1746091 RepID=A0ABQ8Z7H6_9EUKA|nr:conditional loss-of-growth 1 [Anaeramoeba flamelloides]
MESNQIFDLCSRIIHSQEETYNVKKAKKEISLLFRQPHENEIIYRSLLITTLQDSNPSNKLLIQLFKYLNQNLNKYPPNTTILQRIFKFISIIKDRKNEELIKEINNTIGILNSLTQKQNCIIKNQTKDKSPITGLLEYLKNERKKKRKKSKKTRKKEKNKPKTRNCIENNFLKSLEFYNINQDPVFRSSILFLPIFGGQFQIETNSEIQTIQEKNKNNYDQKKNKENNNNNEYSDNKNNNGNNKKNVKKNDKKNNDNNKNQETDESKIENLKKKKETNKNENHKSKFKIKERHLIITPNGIIEKHKSQFLSLLEARNKKKQTIFESSIMSQADISTLNKNKKQLFQYKHYIEQENFNFKKNEIQLISQTILNSNEDSSVTKKTLFEFWIKIAIECYLMKGIKEFALLIKNLCSMLNAEQTNKKLMAFNLLFNLLIHSNLIFDIEQLNFKPKSNDNDNDNNKNKSNGNNKNSDKKNDKKNNNDKNKDDQGKMKRNGGDEKTNNIKKYNTQLNKIEEILLITIQDMVVQLSANEEKSSKVWKAAMNCFLFFLTNGERIDFGRIKRIKLEIILIFLEMNHFFTAFSIKYLIRILLNYLYQKKTFLDFNSFPSELTKNHFKLILDIYSKTTNFEIKENIFYFIYDYSVSKIQKRRWESKKYNSAKEDKNELKNELLIILYLLIALDFPYYFSQLFLYCPKRFFTNFEKYLMKNLFKMGAKPELKKLLKSINKKTLNELFEIFKKLILIPSNIANKFKPAMEKTLKLQVINKSGLKIIQSLIQSTIFEFKHSGKTWLFKLLQLTIFPTDKKNNFEGTDLLHVFFNSLSVAKNWNVRYSYLEIVEKLLLFCKFYLIKRHNQPEKINQLFFYFNNMIEAILNFNEKNSKILVYLLEIIMKLISFKKILNNNLDNNSDGNIINSTISSNYDSLFQRIINNEWVCSSNLLLKINPNIFPLIIQNLQPNRLNSNSRICALLIFMIQNEDGHPLFNPKEHKSFLEKLVFDKDMLISHYTASFYQFFYLDNNLEQYHKLKIDLKKKYKNILFSQIKNNVLIRVREIIKMVNSEEIN